MALFFDWKVVRVLMVVGLSSPLSKSSFILFFVLFAPDQIYGRTIDICLGPPPLRGSFFLENGTLRDTREKNPEIGSKNLT